MEKFKSLPEPLQKHVASRLVFGCVLLALGFICCIFLQSWLLCLPGFVAGGFLVFSGSKLFFQLASGDYLCLQGVCLEMEKAKLGRQIRRMLIDIEGKHVQLKEGSFINLRGRLDEEVWTDKNDSTRRSVVIIAEDIEYAGGKPQEGAEPKKAKAQPAAPPAQEEPAGEFTGYEAFGGSSFFDED